MINQDARVTPGSLDSMVGAISSDSNIAIVGPLTNDPAAGSVNVDFGDIKDYSESEMARIDQFAKTIRERFDGGYKDVRSLSAFFWTIKKDFFIERVCFDERYYPTFWEDTDFSHSARRDGYRLILDPSTFVFHGRVGSSKLSYILKHHMTIPFFVNLVRFCAKNGVGEIFEEVKDWASGFFPYYKGQRKLN